jgi:diguanylate cyclase (GGDEF)-like protein
MSAGLPTEAIQEALRKKLRILIAEAGSGEISRILKSLFPDAEGSLELTDVSNAAALLPTIQLVAPEIVFLDLALFPNEPLAAVRSVRRAAPNIPLIALARSADKQQAEKSLQEGAMDYVLKEYADGNTLGRILRGALERNTVSGLTDLLRDPQTGMYTREGFSALAQRALQAAQRSGGQLVLFTAVLENVASLREEFGPSAGDRAIKDVSALLQGSFRRTDVVARLGETEFAVLAMHAAEPSAAVMLQRVKTHLAGLNQTRGPWGKLALRLDAVFWSAKGGNPVPGLFAALHGMEKPGARPPENAQEGDSRE